jgi:hypothetical protein
MQGCAREALEMASLLPKQLQQRAKKGNRKDSYFVNACDVSDLLEYSYADLLILSEQNPDAACEESLMEIGDAIRSTPEWILGLAALPLTLRKIQDASNPECVRYCSYPPSCHISCLPQFSASVC